jgi:arginase family enzyme
VYGWRGKGHPPALLRRPLEPGLDTGAFPLANFPHFAGLTLEETAACLEIFCRSGKLAGLVVTEVNPDHDPDAILVPALIDTLCGALRPARG